MNIAVYSGSFNPLHVGHLAVIRHLIGKADFDMVYLIVSPKNPLKDSISGNSATDRFNAAVEAVGRHFGTETSVVKVDAIELAMPEPHYTIRTLKALKEREPGNEFTLVIGADNLACIRKWKEYQNILTDFGVAVFPREGHALNAITQSLISENPTYRIQLMDAPLVTISSTEIREAMQQGKDMSQYLM